MLLFKDMLERRYDGGPEGQEAHINMPELGHIADTAMRFSLVRSTFSEVSVRDIVSEHEAHGYSRFLVVDRNVTDIETYHRLANAGVPQLPLITETTAAGKQQLLFGVRDGLKPLIHEALFSRESSATYISDDEIFHKLGRLYRQAWNETGKLMLDPENDKDSPLWHVAIHSFQDGRNLLHLCPPYSPHQPREPMLDEARVMFDQSLGRELTRRALATLDEGDRQSIRRLRHEANRGFSEE